MNNSWKKHYQAKFPGGRVHLTENTFDVHCKDGHHQVKMEKSGAGIWQDRSVEHDCVSRHDGEPVDLEVDEVEAPAKSSKKK